MDAEDNDALVRALAGLAAELEAGRRGANMKAGRQKRLWGPEPGRRSALGQARRPGAQRRLAVGQASSGRYCRGFNGEAC